MAGGFLQYICCLIILTLFVKRGDGRWKRKDRENLQKNIELFRSMADNIEYEIGSFYDEYPDERIAGNIDRVHYRYAENILENIKTNAVEGNVVKHHVLPKFMNNTIELSNIYNDNENNVKSFLNVEKSNILVNKKFDWPTFEEIMLEMGKRYDWKNDRWLKVKRKFKKIRDGKPIENNNIDLHEKHKFYYRIVKLNKSKTRRNVVVAVSAVR